MRHLSRIIACAMLALLLAGSAGAQDDDKSGADQLRLLNDGYSMLYAGVSGLANADKLFLVKVESEDTQRVVTDAVDTMAGLTARLEKLAEDYPSLRLNLQPLPEMERRKQDAATAARIKGFAPVVGRTGPDFERTLLLTLAGGLNQLRHLARVMAQAERSEQRRSFLTAAEDRMDARYDEMQRLLNEKFYTHNTYEPGGG